MSQALDSPGVDTGDKVVEALPQGNPTLARHLERLQSAAEEKPAIPRGRPAVQRVGLMI